MHKLGIWTDETTFKEFSRQDLKFNFATLEKSRSSILSFLKILPDPDVILKKIGKDISALRELTDNRLDAALLQRFSTTSSLTPFFAEKNKSLEWLFANINLGSLIEDILSAKMFGYSVMELMWEATPNGLLPTKIIQKPQEWFRFGRDGEIRFLTRGNMEGVEVPPNKFLVCQNNPTYINPYGEKLLSKVFWFVVFRKNGWKYFARFAEKYGMPWAIGKMPGASGQDKINGMLDALESIVQDAIGVIPDNSSVELLTVAGKGGEATHKAFLEMCAEEISIAVCGQNLTSSVKEGSYAAANVHLSVLETIQAQDKAFVQKYLNELIAIIAKVNGFAPVKLELTQEDEIDANLSERDERLSRIGVKFTKKYFVKNYGFEEDDIEVGGVDAKPSNFSESPNNSQNELDTALNAALDSKEVKGALNSVLTPILEGLNASGDYNEALNALAEAIPNLDDKTLGTLLEKAIFISEAHGLTNA